MGLTQADGDSNVGYKTILIDRVVVSNPEFVERRYESRVKRWSVAAVSVPAPGLFRGVYRLVRHEFNHVATVEKYVSGTQPTLLMTLRQVKDLLDRVFAEFKAGGMLDPDLPIGLWLAELPDYAFENVVELLAEGPARR